MGLSGQKKSQYQPSKAPFDLLAGDTYQVKSWHSASLFHRLLNAKSMQRTSRASTLYVCEMMTLTPLQSLEANFCFINILCDDR